MPPKQQRKLRDGEEFLLGVIGDEDTVTGFLLTGIGDSDPRRGKNFFVVTSRTTQPQIEEAMKAMLARQDLAVIVITQAVANDVRHLIEGHQELLPAVVEIPTKEKPYNAAEDSIYKRVRLLLGERD